MFLGLMQGLLLCLRPFPFLFLGHLNGIVHEFLQDLDPVEENPGKVWIDHTKLPDHYVLLQQLK